jgi:hypothetical protein
MAGSIQTWSIMLGIAAIGVFANAQADFDAKTGQWTGDVSPQSFAEYCRGELPADRQATFFAELDKAERVLAARNTADAKTALGKALSAVYRGGAETDIAVKCLGEPIALRWFTTQLALRRQVSRSGPRGTGPDYTTLYVAAADRGTDGIVEVVSSQSATRFVRSVQTLKGIVDRIEADRKYGAFILPGEEAIEKACRDAVDPLSERARREHRATLAAEDQAFNRPATGQEIEATNAMGGAEALASAIAGVKVDATFTKETMVMRQRVSESRELLSTARIWNLGRYDDIQSRPTSQRARKRGDALLARANDTQHSFGARDRFYDYAIAYYKFGHWDNQVAKAASARDAIQPALQAERERQRANREKAREDMASRAEQVNQAREKMNKTEAEKQTFREEADALEAELGF